MESLCRKFILDEYNYEKGDVGKEKMDENTQNGAKIMTYKELKAHADMHKDYRYRKMLECYENDVEHHLIFQLEKDACLSDFTEVCCVPFKDDSVELKGMVKHFIEDLENVLIKYGNRRNALLKWKRFILIEFPSSEEVDTLMSLKKQFNRFFMMKTNSLAGVHKRYIENLDHLEDNFSNKELYNLTTQTFNGRILSSFSDSKNNHNRFMNIINQNLRASQLSCFSKMISSKSPLLSCQGPPGTGKTTLIVELILYLKQVDKNNRILISASSNTAVDNCLIKLHDYDQYFESLNMKISRPCSAIHSKSLNLHKNVKRYTPEELVNHKFKNKKDSSVRIRFGQKLRLVNSTNLVFCTADSCVPGDFKSFDYVIFDEASQCNLPSILSVIFRSFIFCIFVLL